MARKRNDPNGIILDKLINIESRLTKLEITTEHIKKLIYIVITSLISLAFAIIIKVF